jgi:hypothetical protein
MTEETMESGQVENEVKEVPVPKSLTKSDVKPTSGNSPKEIDVLASQLWEHLKPLVEDVSERKAKSLQDRRFSKIEKNLSGAEQAINLFKSLKEQGLSDEDALYRIKTESTIDELKQTIQGLGGKTTSPSVGTGVDVAKRQSQILSDAGIAMDDPGVAEFVGNYNGNDINQYLIDFQNYVIKRLSKKPAPNPANIQPGKTGTPPGDIPLMEQYREELKQIRRGDTMAITNLKNKYRHKGLDIW